MPVIYKGKQSSIANKEGERLYYPYVVLTGNVSTNQIAKEIAELSSLTAGDVKNVVDNLVTVVRRHLQSSESVTLDGFGTFRYTLKSGYGVKTMNEVSATQGGLAVRFLPASTRKGDGTLATRSLTDGARFTRLDAPSGEGQTDGEDGTPQPGGGQGGGEDMEDPMG